MIDPWFSFRLSLAVALLATALVAVIGSACGYLLARRQFPGRELVDAVFTLPLVLPPTVVGYYLLQLLGKNTWFGHGLYLIAGWNPLFTWQAAVIASLAVSLPIMVKTSRQAFARVDQIFEQAAWVLGKSKTETFMCVTLPLCWKDLLAGVALSFTRALGEFGATLMLAGNIAGVTQTMPLAIYQACQTGDDRTAISLVASLTVTSLLSLYLLNKLGAKW